MSQVSYTAPRQEPPTYQGQAESLGLMSPGVSSPQFRMKKNWIETAVAQFEQGGLYGYPGLQPPTACVCGIEIGVQVWNSPRVHPLGSP